ncbi:MAG: M14 family metallopeptidase [Proteobacteria bacterium]|nr:M14 family metallopeptidase [Pseudomonadota bacterium]
MQIGMEYFSYYAPTYARARQKFLKAAHRTGARVFSHVHDRCRGPDGEELAIDVACFGDRSASRQLLVISGTHGQEGFSGSPVQVAWMTSGALTRLPKDVGVVMVHALNPYGFANFSRTNENNVDLNRNFLVRGSSALPANPSYDLLHEHLLVRNWTEAELERIEGVLAKFRTEHGVDALFDTMARGQYAHQNGLMYGGKEREWSNLTLEKIVKETLSDAEKVAFIDWHTGIGEYGKSFFLCFNEHGSPLFDRACEWWGRENVDGVRPHGMARPNYTGLVFNGVQRFLGEAQMCGAVIEFGTRGLGMGRALRLDQWLRRQTDIDRDAKDTLTADMMDAFCPLDGVWRRDTLWEGVKITEQALQGVAAW